LWDIKTSHVSRPSGDIRGTCLVVVMLTLFGCTVSSLCASVAQPTTHYEPTLEFLNRHPLPQWYADAKLGIFIHWGL